MLFNTWFGQMRQDSRRQWYHNPKRPIGKIQLRRLVKGGYNVEYRADTRGNMDIKAPPHIRDFVGLGYPIYNGMFLGPTTVEDLLWPNNPEYDRRVLEGLNQSLDSKVKTIKKGKV